MAQVFFRCSNPQGALVERYGAEVEDLPELREHAERVIRSLILLPTLEDWRNWVLRVSDEVGTELFEMPFTSVVGRPH